MCIAFDDLCARARYAIEVNGFAPAIGGGPLVIRNGRHPLLTSPPSQGSEVVPFDLALAPDEFTVLVSGPNTGGKTVLIKAVGLLCLMAQSGIIPPIGPHSTLPAFTTWFADIGDRQSIAQSLSTFSAHVAVLRDILARAGAGSLVLLDEIGSGTDPAEGAALASAVLRTLTRRRSVTLATSHLGALKKLATQTVGRGRRGTGTGRPGGGTARGGRGRWSAKGGTRPGAICSRRARPWSRRSRRRARR